MAVKQGLAAAVAALALGLTSRSEAATTPGHLAVQATILDSCSLTDSTLDFGVVSPTDGVLVRTTAMVPVTCTLGTTFAVGLGDGSNADNGQRRMRRGVTSDYLNYELYRALSGTVRFGDAVLSERLTGQLGLGITATPVLVYGSIPANQAAGAGDYSDSVLITIYF